MKKIIPLVLGLIILLTLSRFSEIKSRLEFRKAVTAFENSNYPKAESILLHLLESDSTKSDLYYLLYQTYWKQEKEKDAFQTLMYALHIEPNQADYWINLGNLYTELRQYDLTRRAYQNAFQLDPSRLGIKQAINSYSGYNLTMEATYKAWIDSTFSWSKQHNRFAIIVDKANRRLFCIENGVIIKQFEIGLGINPVDRKLREGDMCTPEGFYQVAHKKDRGQSEYYRAFYLNYPNAVDRQRLREAKAQGLVPANASPGRDIEIHGEGGGSDWTLGCVALDNEAIDDLYDIVQPGTPVTIVGFGMFSTEHWPEIRDLEQAAIND